MSLKLLFDRENVLPYPWYVADLTMTKDIEKIANAKVKKAFVFFVSDHIYMYYDFASADKIGKNILARILMDEKFYKLAIKNIYKYSQELISFCQKIERKNIGKLNNRQLFSIYAEYIKKLRIARLWGLVPTALDGMEKPYLSDYIFDKFGQYLRSIGQEEKISQYYSLLTSSEKKSEVQAEELARLELFLEINNKIKVIEAIKKNNIKFIEKNYPEIYKLLQKHLKNFGWLTYAYNGPSMSMEYLLKSLGENIKEGNILEQKNKILNHYKNIKKEKTKLIKKLSLPTDLVYAFTVSAEFMFIKDYRKGIYQKSYVAMDKVIDEIAKRIGISSKGVKYLVMDEIKETLIGGQAEKYKKIVKKRMSKCCYVVQNGRIEVYEGKRAEKMINDIQNKFQPEKISEEITELKGMTAYQGKVTGTVKIVLEEKDVAKIKEGDILVSSATNPDLIIAMKRAAAIVTDTGGIISHAAIVSRELKKPCIVGTKTATKVLKDGDKIEVDANKGIVKILKRV